MKLYSIHLYLPIELFFIFVPRCKVGIAEYFLPTPQSTGEFITWGWTNICSIWYGRQFWGWIKWIYISRWKLMLCWSLKLNSSTLQNKMSFHTTCGNCIWDEKSIWVFLLWHFHFYYYSKLDKLDLKNNFVNGLGWITQIYTTCWQY